MRFRFLAPVYADRRYEAVEICEMPATFVPPAACEPLDSAALNAFYAQGPQVVPLTMMRWSDIPMSTMPVTYWTRVDPTDNALWKLTGLGSAMPPVRWTSQADPGSLP
jgi:hypothetical protein